MRVKTSRIIVALLALLGVVVVTALLLTRHHPALYIALVGPMSGPQMHEGQNIVKSVNLYLERVNAAGGIAGKQVKLLVLDDQNDIDQARAQARNIATNNQALAVIGHKLSSTSLAAGEIYQQFGVPVITASATNDRVTQGNEWYFRVIFTNSAQGVYLANHARRLMHYDRAVIIYDLADAYSTSLAKAFENTFWGLRGTITQRWIYDSKAPDLQERITAMVNEIRQAERAGSLGLIFLSAQKSEAAPFLVEMKRQGVRLPIFAGDAVGDAATLSRLLAAYPEEQATPGYFSNGVHVATPLLFDIANRQALGFRRTYTERYGEEPNWIEASHYDAAQVVVAALRQADVSGNPTQVQAERRRVRHALEQMDSVAKAVDGLSGPIFFDRHHNAVRAVHVGVYANTEVISVLTQMKTVPDLERVLDLDKALATGEILIVNNQYMYKTHVVYTGLDINEITDLDIRNATYSADFFLWFRYDSDLDPTRIQFLNAAEPLELGEPITESVSNGVTYKAYRVKAKFRGDFDFRAYPFDQQHLTIQFRHRSLTRDRLIYVRDEIGMRDTGNDAVLSRLQRSEAFASLQNWQAKAIHIFQDVLTHNSTLGNPQFFATEAPITYSSFHVDLVIQREFLSFGIKNLFPLCLFIALSFLVVCLPFKVIPIPALIMLLLGTSVFHLNLSNTLPPGIGYVVALDYIFYAMYAVILFELLVVVLGNTQRFITSDDKLRQLMRTCRWTYAVSLSIVLGVLLVTYGNIRLPHWPPTSGIGTASSVGATLPPLEQQPHKTPLTFGSFWSDKSAQISRILAVFNRQQDDLSVTSLTIPFGQYQTTLDRLLVHGSAPDVFLIDGTATARKLFERGLVTPLENVPALQERLPPDILRSFTASDGSLYVVPLRISLYAILYNRDMFASHGFAVPRTWEELLDTARALRAAGLIPFANGSKEAWAVTQLMFMNLAPSFLGGRQGRLAYFTGEQCFNDTYMVRLFQALADLAPLLPAGHASLGLAESRDLFLQGQAAMYLGSTWEFPALFGTMSAESTRTWGIFAPPAPTGQRTAITRHAGILVGLNAASPHQEAAKSLLAWLTTSTAAELFSREMPGFFHTAHNAPLAPLRLIRDAWALQEQYDTDAFFASPPVTDGLPDATALIAQGTLAVLQGRMSPQEAADHLQFGLSQWFEPAQICLRRQHGG
jgi:branched-chain amino acid transport system substrate-binding protein